MVRLLVLDGSRVLPTLVRRLVPADVEVEAIYDFEQAVRALEDPSPVAAIVNLSASDLPWKRFKHLCECHSPPIPVLFESCVHNGPEDAGIGALGSCAAFITKPYTLDELRAEIGRLVDAVQPVEGSGSWSGSKTEH